MALNIKKSTEETEVTDYGYYSKLLKKPFNTLEELQEAENVFKKKNELEIKRQEEKKEKLKEIEVAYKEFLDAGKKYEDLKQQFIKQYGYYHTTYTDKDSFGIKSIFDFFTTWF